MKTQDMIQRYRKFKRAWGMWYAFDTGTGNSVSLKTRVKAEAVQKVNAMNETERQPSISLGLAVSGHSKPATKGRMKTSHFEGSIAFGAAWAALGRNERTQRELAAFDFNFGGQRLVQPADCA
jgi:hypothetical protein